MSTPILQTAPVDLKSNVARWIEQRTGSRIHGLRVDIVNGRAVVYGWAGSHYVRQLALAAALEAAEPGEVEVRIQVN